MSIGSAPCYCPRPGGAPPCPRHGEHGLTGAQVLDQVEREQYEEIRAERDRYRQALLRVFRDRREADKVFAECSSALGFEALEEAGLVPRATNQKEVTE